MLKLRFGWEGSEMGRAQRREVQRRGKRRETTYRED
jgi:hypothetical protein